MNIILSKSKHKDGNAESHKTDGTITTCTWETVTPELIRVIFSKSTLSLNIENKDGKITLFTTTDAGDILTTYSAQPINS